MWIGNVSRILASRRVRKASLKAVIEEGSVVVPVLRLS